MAVFTLYRDSRGHDIKFAKFVKVSRCYRDHAVRYSASGLICLSRNICICYLVRDWPHSCSTSGNEVDSCFHHQWRSQLDIWSCKCKFFCVYRPYKESISKEMNNDNDLNLHLHYQMSCWLRYCSS